MVNGIRYSVLYWNPFESKPQEVRERSHPSQPNLKKGDSRLGHDLSTQT
jgi:hypothetical protein